MSQQFTDNPYVFSDVAATDLTNMNNNFAALKSCFSGNSQPPNPVAGMLWFDTSSGLLKIRNTGNSAWIEIYDHANDRAVWKTAQLADGILTANAAGRAKMASLFVTNALINDVDGSKIADNTVSQTKIQNNAVSPSKMAVGAANMWDWTYYPGGIGSDQAVVVSSGAGSSWSLVMRAYRYFPPGVKYIVLALRGASQNQQGNFRLYVEGYTGSNCGPPYNSGVVSTNGAAFDVSALNSAFRVVELQCQDNGGVLSLQSFAVQFWGA